MGKISGYLTLDHPLGDEILIGTDIHHSDVTKNFSIQSLFNIGLDITASKIKLYDTTIEDYGEITLDNDVFRVKGAPTNTRNLLMSSATGYLSFKKNNYDVKLDATSVTDNRTYILPDTDGTVALVETTDLQQVTTAGNTTSNQIFIPKLNLFDSVFEGYANIQCINSEWIFENAANQNVFSINSNGITLKNTSSTYSGNISTELINDYQDYLLPNKSGTFALTSDVPVVPYKVFTALLTQSGVDTEDTISSGLLTIGVTYYINTDSPGMDFTNVGAPNNNLGTAFIATGTTPNSWGSGSALILAYSAGAPVATVLENTIGNVSLRYTSQGRYMLSSNGLFTEDKTVCAQNNQAFLNFGSGLVAFMLAFNVDNTEFDIQITDTDGYYFDDALNNQFIEIRVYN